MPEEWWYMNNSYTRNNPEKKKYLDILEKEKWGNKFFNN
jgi:hypothetical protein